MGKRQRPSVKRLRRERIARERLMKDSVHYVDANKKLSEITNLIQAARQKVAPRARPNGYYELGFHCVTQMGDIVFREGSWQDTEGEMVDGIHVFLRPEDNDDAVGEFHPHPSADTGLGMDDFLRL